MRWIAQVEAWTKDSGECFQSGILPQYLRFMGLHFVKWEGTGNDFVLVDGRQEGLLPSDWSPAQIQAICDRHHGVGADGVVVVKPCNDADLLVDFRNPDGSRSFCGNGTRSALAWAMAEGLVGDHAVLRAVDGLHQGKRSASGLPGISLAVQGEVNWLEPQVDGATRAAFLHTGSPHHVEWVSDREALDGMDLVATARPIRHSEAYAPDGTNVNVVAPGFQAGTLHIRTYERGVEAETRSCGTGVVASALADMVGSDPGKHSRAVHARGGDLEVTATVGDDGSMSDVWLFGEAREVFRGVWKHAWLWAWLTLLPGMVGASDWAEGLSDEATVSVLTASPGHELYASFGHTAFRVQDPMTDTDVVFNYGTFRVDDGFYVRFVQGQMTYRLGTSTFGRFQHAYLRDGRAMLEQTLQLTPDEMREVAAFLEVNARPENAQYSYSFFRDNCSTKVVDVMKVCFGDRFEAGCEATDLSYHDALRPYTRGLPWASWGIELILGRDAEATMPPCGHAFLPDQMAHQLTLMTLDGSPLASAPMELFPVEGRWHAGLAEDDPGRKAPARTTWGLALMMLVLAWGKRQGWTRLARWAGGAVGALGSLVALLFVAMQGITDHSDTWWNADFVWASLGFWAVAGGAGLAVQGPRARLALGAWTALAWVTLAMAGGLEVWATTGAAAAMTMAAWIPHVPSSR